MKLQWTLQDIVNRLPKLHNELHDLLPEYRQLKAEYEQLYAMALCNQEITTGSNQAIREAQAKSYVDGRFTENGKLVKYETLYNKIASLRGEREILMKFIGVFVPERGGNHESESADRLSEV